MTDRSGVEGVQRRSFLCFGGFAGLLAQQPSAHQQHQESFSNRVDECLDLVVCRRLGRRKPERAIGLSNEDPVEYKAVEVDVQVQRAPESPLGTGSTS